MIRKNIWILSLGFASFALIILGLYRLTYATQDVEARAYCHATESEGHPYNYLFNTAWVQHLEDNGTPKSGHELDFFTQVGDTDCNGETPTVTPTATPSATLTPTPIVECDKDECVTPSPEPTRAPEPTVIPTEAPKSEASVPHNDCSAINDTPTITGWSRVSPTKVKFTWSETGNINDYVVYYGLTENNLVWNKMVFDAHETTLSDLPENTPIWASIAGTDNVCVGARSAVVDP
jgi:hypothetical protein